LGVARCDWTTFTNDIATSTLPVFHKFHNGAWTELACGGVSTPLTTQLASNDVWCSWGDFKYYAPANIYVGVFSSKFDQSVTGQNLRAMYSYDGLNWFGDDVLACPNICIYPTLYSPDAPVGQLGVTNYIFSTQTTNLANIYGFATLSRYKLNLTMHPSIVAGTANVGTLNILH
jgi:hypothetical protein